MIHKVVAALDECDVELTLIERTLDGLGRRGTGPA